MASEAFARSVYKHNKGVPGVRSKAGVIRAPRNTADKNGALFIGMTIKACKAQKLTVKKTSLIIFSDNGCSEFNQYGFYAVRYQSDIETHRY